MQVISTQKFVRMSPRKLRLVADLVRGKRVPDVLEFAPFVEKRAMKPVLKVVRTAAANARARGVDSAELTIKSIEVGEGPKLKRFRAVSRGQAHGYVKQMSHIRVILSGENPKPKSQSAEPAEGVKKMSREKKAK